MYTIAAVNRDPKKPMPSKQSLWPIPEIDKDIQEENSSWADEARRLLDHYKSMGKI